MSAKWERSKAWDDAVFAPWAWPLKAVLRAFSSIRLAVVLLTGVMLYGILASVPIGLLAKAPTYLFYGLTLVVSMGLVAGLGLVVVGRALRNAGRGVRWTTLLLVGLGLGAATVFAWAKITWPVLRYDWGTGSGVMFFADFVDRYKSTTLRRLPGMEMTELEFYAWWPLRVMLLAFVANMVTATVRRIEFKFVNLGVLMVHSGIVLLALGSVYYGSLKKEGESLLRAGPPDEAGNPTPGPWQMLFFDNTTVALHARAQLEGWQQIPLRNIPRYNDYGLGVSAGRTAWEATGATITGLAEGSRELSIDARRPRSDSAIADLRFRVVGYASYALPEPRTDWLKVDPADLERVRPDFKLNPLRIVQTRFPGADLEEHGAVLPWFFLPESPKGRLAEMPEIGIEFVRGIDATRLADLKTRIPEGTTHAACIEVPRADGETFRGVFPLAMLDGSVWSESIALGDTGFTIQVVEIDDSPDLPIITPGYEGAHSSLLKLRITPPTGDAYTRWVHHRFPEIAQDLFDAAGVDGRPQRRAADPSIRVGYIDASKVQAYIIEDEAGSVSVVTRLPGAADAVVTPLDQDRATILGGIELRVTEKWAHAERFDRPVVAPREARDRDKIGTHETAQMAIEVTSARFAGFRRIVWLPYTRFLDAQASETSRTVTLPDGSPVTLAFGRLWHEFPGFAVRLDDFQMLEYDHRGAPRDYQSTLSVSPTRGENGEPIIEFKPFTHVASLNAPLRAPFDVRNPERGVIGNFFGRLAAGLNPGQYKFSQAGWDRGTWEETRRLVDEGTLKRPLVGFTILHVGNNPGIHIVALGGILMALGIPWAFYLKPWLLRRQKVKIQKQLAEGSYVPPRRRRRSAPDSGPVAPAQAIDSSSIGANP